MTLLLLALWDTALFPCSPSLQRTIEFSSIAFLEDLSAIFPTAVSADSHYTTKLNVL